METKAEGSSQHLATARRLLNALENAPADPRIMAETANAHATLVLAEQVAAVRVLLVGSAVKQRENGAEHAEAAQA
jgi:hypothetical protein